MAPYFNILKMIEKERFLFNFYVQILLKWALGCKWELVLNRYCAFSDRSTVHDIFRHGTVNAAALPIRSTKKQ